jgi:hypothetical protein
MSLTTESCKNIWTWTADGHTGMAPGCEREQPVLQSVNVWQPSWNGYMTISIVSVQLHWQTTLQNGLSYGFKLGLKSVLMEKWKELWTSCYAAPGQTTQKGIVDTMLRSIRTDYTERKCGHNATQHQDTLHRKELWTPRYEASGQTTQKAVKTSEFTAHLFLLLVRTDKMLSRLSSKLTSRICTNISCCDSNPQACQGEKKHLQKLSQVKLQVRQQ